MEISEYGRTKDGKIGKIASMGNYVVWIGEKEIIFNDEIVKHSENIIDLIEVGDIIDTVYGKGALRYKVNENTISFDDNEDLFEIEKGEIKSILTKENYEKNCYKVVE